MEKNVENLESVKSFNNELASLYECKPPISRAKMVQITKSAMKAMKYYKHVVLSVEKFIQKCRPEYKLPGLYVIDSIVRQSRHQYSAEKDVFAPRFSKNIAVTFQALFKCPDEDKTRIVRVLRLWMKNCVFPEDDLRPLVEIATRHGCDVAEVTSDQNGKGDSTAKKRRTPSPEMQHSPVVLDRGTTSGNGSQQAGTNLDPAVFSRLQKLATALVGNQPQKVDTERMAAQKLLADDDYSDEESGGEETGEPQRNAPDLARNDLSANLAAAAQNLLKNPELLQQIHQMQQSMRGPAGTSTQGGQEGQIQQRYQHPPPPAVLNMQQPPPTHPIAQPGFPPPSGTSPPPQPPFIRGHENQAYAPPAEPLPPESALPFGRPHWPTNMASERLLDRDERRRGPEPPKRRSRSRSRERRRRSSRSRSRSPSGSRSGRRRNRSRSSDRRNKEHERERRKQGLPPMKSRHISICTRTLWFGRVPASCEQHEIKDALKDYGEPVSIDLITPRGCAYVVMPDRKSAYKVLDRLRDSMKIQGRTLKMAWAPGKGVKEYKNGWEVDSGVTYLPWDCLPNDLTPLLDGSSLDVESLPDHLKGQYTESGRVDGISLDSIPQPVVSMVPPPFPGFAGVPPPNVFPTGVIPPPFGQPTVVPLGIPAPLPGATQPTGLRQPAMDAGSVMGDPSAASQIPSMPLYGQHMQMQHQPHGIMPNYARPVHSMESGGFVRPRGFMRGGNRARFDGPPPPPMRGRGGMRGRGEFGRPPYRGRGVGPRGNWGYHNAGRFDGGGREIRPRWSMGGEERWSREHDAGVAPRRSRWSAENENFASGADDNSEVHAGRGGPAAPVPAVTTESSEHASGEPPPPGE